GIVTQSLKHAPHLVVFTEEWKQTSRALLMTGDGKESSAIKTPRLPPQSPDTEREQSGKKRGSYRTDRARNDFS
ncbi:hypothetical protein JOQ06_026884, partial [Pogonophryne albipinna]